MKEPLCFRMGCSMRVKEKNKEYMNKYRYLERVKKMREERCFCNNCSELAQVLHHKDEDHSNNASFNLVPLCRKCHLKISHESDYSLQYEENSALNAQNRPRWPVTQPNTGQDIPLESVTRNPSVVIMRKNGIIIRVNASLRTCRIIEDLGYVKECI